MPYLCSMPFGGCAYRVIPGFLPEFDSSKLNSPAAGQQQRTRLRSRLAPHVALPGTVQIYLPSGLTATPNTRILLPRWGYAIRRQTQPAYQPLSVPMFRACKDARGDGA